MPERGGEPARATPAPVDAVLVRLRDGVRLATDIYLPQPLRGRIPAALVRGCYDKSSAITGATHIAAEVTARGYALVVQDVQGTFGSGGERTPWLHEARDGFDVIDWIVRQSWCDERVVMLGDSYLGFTQWAAAASAHPGLRAIAPRVASQRVPDAWFCADIAAPIGAEWLARWWSGPEATDLALDWRTRPVLEAIPAELANARELHREFLSLNEAELHAAIYPGPLPATRLAIPALHAGAWFDLMTPYQMRDWAAVSNHCPAAGDQFLVMAAEDHTGHPFHPGAVADDAAIAAAGTTRVRRVLDFFDHYLRDTAVAPTARVRYEVAGAGWRVAERWPPPEVQELQLFLTGDASGRALGRRPGRPGELTWVHDPADPVPSPVTVDNDMLAQQLPDEQALHLREDVLAFTTEARPTALDLIGSGAVDLVVASTAPAMHMVATLLDVTPTGAATAITEGIARLDTRYGPASTTVHLAPTAYRVPAGHRLRLALACTRFPRYLVHPGTDDNLWTAVEDRPATQTLTVGGSSGSRLRLGTIPADRPTA
ncbi:MAG: CocE/NonD family hydrolase [Jatrophihabitantaceae bacterium]